MANGILPTLLLARKTKATRRAHGYPNPPVPDCRQQAAGVQCNMRVLVALLACALAGCGPNVAAPKRQRAEPAPPGVSRSITLPGDDGRVHVIDVPGRYEVTRCLVHVGAGASSMTCLPTPEMAPLERERDRDPHR